jgi:hypothetical protein
MNGGVIKNQYISLSKLDRTELFSVIRDRVSGFGFQGSGFGFRVLTLKPET